MVAGPVLRDGGSVEDATGERRARQATEGGTSRGNDKRSKLLVAAKMNGHAEGVWWVKR